MQIWLLIMYVIHVVCIYIDKSEAQQHIYIMYNVDVSCLSRDRLKIN